MKSQIIIMRSQYGEGFNEKLYEKEKRLAESAPELLHLLTCAKFKLDDYLWKLKDSEHNMTESSEYITQLKDYIGKIENILTEIKVG